MATTIASALESRNPYDLVAGRVLEAYLYVHLGEIQKAREAARQASAICREHNFSAAESLADVGVGLAQARLGRAGEGVAIIRQSIASLRLIGFRITLTKLLSWLAEAEALDGKI